MAAVSLYCGVVFRALKATPCIPLPNGRGSDKMRTARITTLAYFSPYLAAAVVVVGLCPIDATAQGRPPEGMKDYSGNCASAGCHADYAKRPVVHGPVAMNSCDACHEKTDGASHRFQFVADGAELCFECHDEPEGKVVHPPVEQGECTACHDPHGSETKKLLTAPTVSEVCAQCHEDIAEDRAYLHGPVAAGACTQCHDPHSADHPALLPASTRDLCLKCHAAIQNRMADKKHTHQPATEDCLTCHDPHGADNRMNLRQAPPELCLDCHDEIGEAIEDASVEHDAVTMGRSCTNCHDPHAADEEHLLTSEQLSLCLSCHDKELASGGRTLINMLRLLSDNPLHHGPIRDKNCTACHEVHGGTNFRLLVESYPATFYSPFEEEHYGLCFTCHEPDMFDEERTDELTGFRNGDRNLHYLHVNRKLKGRTCRACHNVHAGTRPKYIADTVPFGEWDIPINYQQTPTGGSCLPGCHKHYGYDRDTPVSNVPGS